MTSGQRHFYAPDSQGKKSRLSVGGLCTRLLSERVDQPGLKSSISRPRVMSMERGRVSSWLGRHGAGGGPLGSPGCSLPAWSSDSDRLHSSPSSCCRRGEPAGLAMSGRGQEEQSPVLVPHPGLLHPRLLLPGPQPAGEWSGSRGAHHEGGLWENRGFQVVPAAGEGQGAVPASPPPTDGVGQDVLVL